MYFLKFSFRWLRFSFLCNCLEMNKSIMGVCDLNINQTRMEKIFLKLKDLELIFVNATLLIKFLVELTKDIGVNIHDLVGRLIAIYKNVMGNKASTQLIRNNCLEPVCRLLSIFESTLM